MDQYYAQPNQDLTCVFNKWYRSDTHNMLLSQHPDQLQRELRVISCEVHPHLPVRHDGLGIFLEESLPDTQNIGLNIRFEARAPAITIG